MSSSVWPGREETGGRDTVEKRLVSGWAGLYVPQHCL